MIALPFIQSVDFRSILVPEKGVKDWAQSMFFNVRTLQRTYSAKLTEESFIGDKRIFENWEHENENRPVQSPTFRCTKTGNRIILEGGKVKLILAEPKAETGSPVAIIWRGKEEITVDRFIQNCVQHGIEVEFNERVEEIIKSLQRYQ